MFSKTTQYALRLMACVARWNEGKPIRSTDLALVSQVPAAYISKVMRRLEDAGLVESRKGRGGGFWLARPAEEIHLAEILRAVDEPSLATPACVFGWEACSSDEPCPLHAGWIVLRSEISAWADQTLAELLSIATEE